MSTTRIVFVVLLAVLGGFLSGLLLFEYHGVSGATAAVDELCGAGENSGCDRVSRSRYSSVGSFSVAGIGLFFYGSMLLLLAFALTADGAVRGAMTSLALASFGAALIVDLVLLGLQAFAIGAFCKLCLATYGVNLVALGVLWPTASNVKTMAATLADGEGKRGLLAWAAGSVVLLLSIGAVEGALGSVEERLEASLLGVEPSASPVTTEPPPATEPEPEPEPEPVLETPVPPPMAPAEDDRVEFLEAELASTRGELQSARDQIRDLRATLDDPQKYEEYQAEKAQKQFEQEKTENLALGGIPFKGPEDAPIRVVEYSDFLCPFCRNLAGAFANYLPRSGGRVAIFYKNYPLDQACNPGLSRTVHDGACELALGAVCAAEQDKFWPYHDRVFRQPPENPSAGDVVSIAAAAGADAETMRACMESSAAKEKLAAQIEEAKRLQVTSTPTVYINGKRLQQLGGFLKAIESEVERLGLE